MISVLFIAVFLLFVYSGSRILVDSLNKWISGPLWLGKLGWHIWMKELNGILSVIDQLVFLAG